MNTEFEKIKKANILINSLCIFTNIKQDNVLINYKALLKYLNKKEISIEKGITLYNDFVYELLKKANGTSFKKFIIDMIFLDNNSFTNMIDREDLSNKYIIKQVKYELKSLENITSIASYEFKEAIIHKGKAKDFEIEIINSLIDFEVNSDEDYDSYKAIDKLKLNILSCDNWGNSLESIIEFFKQYGTGIFGEYKAFVWEHEENNTYLRGIDAPDPINLKDLVGYEDQKETIIENTKQFLNGYPANNILLYGSRGTGKSSTVKAITNEYYTEGLRLIEVDKSKLVDFTKIIRILKNKNLKFIIFVDDLVFEEGEASYSALKTILEGGVENRSNNILIYATTNRKHLVKETFSERATDDVHTNDTIEEKLSLSDRFGITVSFYSPDQKEYLKIIDGIVESRNLEVDMNYLHAEALKWVRWHNARSPRTANQFINWLEGTLKSK
ncbi:replication factor C large subunit [Clostridium puniceum]|uniref:Replication factor C large subunit n=1 Tax=Clostridium puniceum TaxID=29367 RepID=A0A1S8TIG9_9CLOT|nr:ATP-binding protein [Clostridium puniceum]OOM77399.1 replication factor C large subunit [Clostridium puniceum]